MMMPLPPPPLLSHAGIKWTVKIPARQIWESFEEVRVEICTCFAWHIFKAGHCILANVLAKFGKQI